MHFMFFSAQYLPTVGGVERYTASLGKELVKNGHRVTVVTSALPGLPAEETGADGIAVIRLPVIPLIGGRFPVLRLSSQKAAFKKLFVQHKPDFCVIQTRFYTNSIMAARLCKKHRVPALVVEHGTAHLMRGGLTGILGDVYEHLVCRYIHGKCLDFYGVSVACCDWLRHFGIETDRVLYNSVTPAELRALAEKGAGQLHEKLPAGIENKVKFVFSARFIPEKGVEPLLHAFGRVRENHPDAVLLMAGDGPLWQKADADKPENVYLLGRLSYEANLALIAMGDAFVLPTFSEGFATTVLEAAALGTVVLTTPTGGSPQLIPDAEHGCLFPSMAEEDIFEALEAALADAEWRRRAAAAAYDNLLHNFTWEETCRRLVATARQKTGEEKKA
ncbi:MAG: glycosyltransferase family 4 protein [Oscillospiraceae bacterium]|nr:glycosyltransferase family 4 protein [Oscillospiraceae bacterium]MBQ8612566.1 glycosyltransferase family 4 protein [Oscillospiraceae bacterium]